MLLLVAVAMAVAAVPLAGGRLSLLAEVRFTGVVLLWAALLLQVLVTLVLRDASTAAVATLHLASYELAGGFLWLNRRVPGVVPAGIGGALNVVAIAANGGTMPASATATARAGLPVGDAWTNSAPLASPHLLPLGDVLAVPAGWPLANVYSVGDVLLTAGVAFGVHRICGSRFASRRALRPAG